ncbi:MAG TPA: hemerythrin family protein [Terracidiphilus sp.]|nr:hemerythrin family protein [Terracidiphilus sp.]
MTLLTLNDTCSIGARAMDDQHGILMDTMNELRQALVLGAGREQLREVLDRLIEFTRMHFWSEEQLMEQSAFPGLAEHRSEHHGMLAQMIQSAHRVQYGQGAQMRPLVDLLCKWFAEHIESLDRHYGVWLNERGVY